MGFTYDSNLDLIFMYGGKDELNAALDTTWKLDPNTITWTNLSIGTGTAHAATRMVYDPVLNVGSYTAGKHRALRR